MQGTRASETVAKAISQVQQRQKEEELETARYEERVPNLPADSKPWRWQLTKTCETTPEYIWKEIDMLEGDPAHRGMAMRNARFEPFWLTAEASEWEGLWDKGAFKNWNRSDLLKNDRVFTSRYVYKIK